MRKSIDIFSQIILYYAIITGGIVTTGYFTPFNNDAIFSNASLTNDSTVLNNEDNTSIKNKILLKKLWLSDRTGDLIDNISALLDGSHEALQYFGLGSYFSQYL